MKNDNSSKFVIKKKQSFFDMTSKEKGVFLAQMAGVFLAVFIILYALGFVPEQWKGKKENVVIGPKNTQNTDLNNIDSTEAPQTSSKPSRVYIPSVGIDTVVNQPESQNVAVLDQALQTGAVYYPGSGVVERGNMFIFGHSTNWKVVRNQAYKTFNGLDKLNPGDEIYVESDGQTYLYKVEFVELVNDSEALIDLAGNERKLTISTCNSFGEKQERWVAHADFIRKI